MHAKFREKRAADEVGRLGLNIDEAATAIGVCRRTVCTLITTGRLKSIKIGRRRVIPVAAVRDLLGE